MPSSAKHSKKIQTTWQKDVSQQDKKNRFAADLDCLFEMALTAGNFASALKAKELIGKTAGFFHKEESEKNVVSDIKDFSDTQLDQLIQSCQTSEKR